jgi:hypothetical protein
MWELLRVTTTAKVDRTAISSQTAIAVCAVTWQCDVRVVDAVLWLIAWIAIRQFCLTHCIVFVHILLCAIAIYRDAGVTSRNIKAQRVIFWSLPVLVAGIWALRLWRLPHILP